MKITTLFLVMLLSVFNYANAQSKDQSLQWIETNLLHIVSQNGNFTHLKIADINECRLVLSWKNKEGDPIEMIYLTNDMQIDEYGRMKYTSQRSRPHKIGYENGSYDPIIGIAGDVIYIQPDKREVFKKHMKTLASSCEEKIIRWTSRQEAWDWLKSTILKYGYAKYTVETENGNYFPQGIKDVRLEDCAIVITYDLYKGGWDNTLEGTLTEKIPLKNYRLSDVQQNLQNDDNNNEPVITVINAKETSPKKTFMSVTKFVTYSDNFVKNVENVLIYLKNQCK